MVAQTDGVLNFTIIMTTSSGVLTSDMSLQSVDQNATGMPSTPSGSTADSQAMQYIIPLCIFIVLCLLAVMVYIIIRKKHLDHLRHHLMPLYNFDPTEEGEDWEVELLEEGVDHHSVHRGYKSMDFPRTENTDLFRR